MLMCTYTSILIIPTMSLLSSVALDFLALDSIRERFHHHSLSQQALMELVISEMNIDKRLEFQDRDGHFLNLENWKGVILESTQVTEIHWTATVWRANANPKNQGTILLKWLPDTLHTLDINNAGRLSREKGFEGCLECNELPRRLKVLNASFNRLHGTLDLQELPGFIEIFNVSDNRLEGHIDLTRLPESLRKLCVGWNRLDGSLNLTQLSSHLAYLSLSGNKFFGDVDFSRLPVSLKHLYIDSNRLCGCLRICDIPKLLETLHCQNNCMTVDRTECTSEPTLELRV